MRFGAAPTGMFATVVPLIPVHTSRVIAPGLPVIVKVRALDTAPPGFCTVTEALPAAAISAAVIAAVSWVALTKLVVRFAPFQRTTEPLTKLLPFTVSVKAAPPAAALLGESVVNVGVEAPVIVKVRALETAPPGFCTVTEALPAAAISAAVIAAVSWVALTKVVVRFAPFQRTTEPLTKLLPFTVSVKAGPPAAALLGESEVNVGAAGPLPTWTMLATDGYSASVEDEEQVVSGRRNSASGRSHNVEASSGLRKAQRADVLAHVESMGHRGESQHRDL